MGQFIFFAILLGCLAVAFAISALWQRARGLAVVLALLLPAAAFGLYWQLGRPVAIDPANTTAPETLPAAVAQLERLTSADPKNFADMATLARAYMATKDWEKARSAYARALALKDDPDLAVEYAEAMLRSSPDRKFPPEAVAILERSVQQNPQNQRALFFLGLHQRQNGQAAQAAETWQRLAALLDPSAAVELRRQIDAARLEAGLEPLAPPGGMLDLHVSLDPTLARAAGPGTVLYVFARKADGGGPPVAVQRLQPDAFPVHLQLGDADSPMPTEKLSAQAEVLVSARISMSGDARPASGDLESDPVLVKLAPGAKVELNINRSVP